MAEKKTTSMCITKYDPENEHLWISLHRKKTLGPNQPGLESDASQLCDSGKTSYPSLTQSLHLRERLMREYCSYGGCSSEMS